MSKNVIISLLISFNLEVEIVHIDLVSKYDVHCTQDGDTYFILFRFIFCYKPEFK
jgi:hypothetical protein